MQQGGDDTTCVAETKKTWQDTTGRGDETELAVTLALVRAGKRLLKPISSAMRYDIVVDNEDGTFTRVQCKTGRLRDGCIRFATYSVSGHTTTSKRYQGEVDAFGVFCPDTGATYLVPMTALSPLAMAGYLRVTPARNGQRRRIREASDYVILCPPARPLP